jgi:type IV secretion system protein VirB9
VNKWLSLVALVFLSFEVVAEMLPLQGSVDSRIRVANFRDDEVYRLVGRVGYQIDIQFEPGETFVGLGAGDIDAISFVAEENHLFLKPKAARVKTNLTVLTNRRHYQIEYSAADSLAGMHEKDVIYAVRFIYSAPNAVGAAAKIDALLNNAGAQRAHNIDYWYCGHPSLKPLFVSDDGVHTRLRFGARAELPAIFVGNDEGGEALVNFSMDAGDVIVHRIARRFILRRGGLAGCVVNKGFAGGGDRLDSGTVAPGVERSTPVLR